MLLYSLIWNRGLTTTLPYHPRFKLFKFQGFKFCSAAVRTRASFYTTNLRTISLSTPTTIRPSLRNVWCREVSVCGDDALGDAPLWLGMAHLAFAWVSLVSPITLSVAVVCVERS